MPPQRRVLVIGASFAGLACGRDLKDDMILTFVDAKEYFEYTPGILRAYVKPKHLDALTFTLQPVIEKRMNCNFIWGEVTGLNGDNKTATIKTFLSKTEDVVEFDFCIIAAGCNFGPFHKWGESLWFPTIHENARPEGNWPHIDERFLEGRRRHILEEYGRLQALNESSASILVVGAGFIGVEWVTELQHFFPKLDLTIIDLLPQPLGPLPARAAQYCSIYMQKKGIHEFYEVRYDAQSQAFWDSIGFEGERRPDKEFVCIGVKASNYFMPTETLSERGPGGGRWILMDQTLAVKTRDEQRWGTDSDGNGRIYAIGDCNYGCIEEPGKKPAEWPIPPIPKISYPGEEEAVVACANIRILDKRLNSIESYSCHGGPPTEVHNMHWPWGAGMFLTSLGPSDACFVAGANWDKGSGMMVLSGRLASLQKNIIETTKTDECAGGKIGRSIWHFVHHTPFHLWGMGPKWGYRS